MDLRASAGQAVSRLRYVTRTIRGLVQHPGFEGTRVTPRRMANLVLNRWEHRALRSTLRSYPIKLIVEVTNICNLRCPACFTGDEQQGRVRGHLSPELYARTIEELGPYLWRVEFCNWGEPLLGKHIVPMIEAATARGISSLISTNFSVPFDAERAERLVASGLTILGVSLDGARQETYEQYRVRGNLETVLRNVRLVNEAKQRLRSATPKLIWSFHVFPHNADDVEQARAMAADLGMEFAVEKGWVVGDEWDPDGRFTYYGNPRPFPCVPLWEYAVLNNDGGVAPCCGSFYREDDVGRVADGRDGGARTFREVWNGPGLRRARGFYSSRDGDEAARRSICFDCPQTVIWERWQRHMGGGGIEQDFDPGYGQNDVFNYFWNRQKLHRPPTDAPRRARG
jgi:MoaA/NifB/PqqE/SkfB family radical SAM enzyme